MPRPWNVDDPWELAASMLSIDGVPPFAQRIVDLGKIDAQLHDAETEIVPDLVRTPDGKYYPVAGTVNHSVALDRAFVISNQWVVELFEIVRYLKESYPKRAAGNTKARLKSIKYDLSLVRSPLIKLQISGTRNIHYPENLIGQHGSLGWRVHDTNMNKHVFTRRQFRDRFFELAHNYNKTSEGEM